MLFETQALPKDEQMLSVVRFSALACMADGLVACAPGPAFDHAFAKTVHDHAIDILYPQVTLTEKAVGGDGWTPSALLRLTAARCSKIPQFPHWGTIEPDDEDSWLTPTSFGDSTLDSGCLHSGNPYRYIEAWVNEHPDICSPHEYMRWHGFGDRLLRNIKPDSVITYHGYVTGMRLVSLDSLIASNDD